MNKSVVVLDEQRKIKMLVGATAIKLAKEADDPLYKKYESARKKYLEYKTAIIKKFGKKASQVVKKAISSKT